MGKLKTLVGGIDSDVSTLTKHLSDTVVQVQAQIASANRGGEDSLFGDDTAASKENLENYRDKLMKALTDAKEEVDNISETYLQMLDDAQDKIDKQLVIDLFLKEPQIKDSQIKEELQSIFNSTSQLVLFSYKSKK